ncbi:MAG: valine--tRNA ligase [Haliscomenobacteraceae bacterium CHB4]|nr:Valine--tRNA ligase [Saprospiraceae bacterium]MCE7923947.1 valine--tRNA ligase [Haliscomenobacteraceae bacterium CHB4]
MELSTRYNPAEIEERWYAHWEHRGYFRSTPDERKPFTIVIPPPNVTGVLHMGHMLNNTIQDILIRKARLDGKNACWVPGTDHASIATEAKVVRWLREEKKLRKADITREQFMEYAYQWKEKYGGIILNQLRKLGASCDWERTAFTMDSGYYRDVIRVFVDLYQKGKLYRGLRMVNWDPEAKTVLSNEEVLYNEENAQLFHIRYLLEDSDSEGITIATQRPETIFADVAVAVNPKDARYKNIVGKKVLIPLINRAIPVIADDYVDIEFGTGALKITPAHDPNDYEVGLRHQLEVIDTISDDGKINELCAYQPIIGLDRFEARKRMKPALEESGHLVKIEDYKTNIGRSERTNAVVEPKLSLQWFVRMSSLGEPALKAVLDEEVKFYPPSFQNLYRTWMENLRDWCVSRQLWWGQRIPAWYLASEAPSRETHVFVAETVDAALEIARQQTGNNQLQASDLRQDDDVLDTWASSWLWPISVFDGFAKPDGEIRYYYPTSVLVTGWDIIFFWVARMIMAGYEYKGQKPFEAVYFTGMVRDKLRRKMSKSLGNSPDALKLLEDFGADGVRYGLMSSAAAGGDILFDEKLCENGRNFCNKLWNALRLVKGWRVVENPESEEVARKNALAVSWLRNKFNAVLADVDNNFQQFRLSEALLTLYGFIWDDFCSWYLEMIKPGFEQPVDRDTYEATLDVFSQMMVALHPFMPFITEELWHQLRNRKEGDDCMKHGYPKSSSADISLIQKVETVKDIISKIRDIRNQNQVKPRDPLVVQARLSDSANALFEEAGLREMVLKMAVLSEFALTEEEPANAQSFVTGTEKYYVVLSKQIDVAAECAKVKQELEHQRGFVRSVEAKLSNERFVGSAPPQVVENERKKLADGQARIKILEESAVKLGCG